MTPTNGHLIQEDELSFQSRNKAVVQYQPCRSKDKSSQEGGDDGRVLNHTQPHNKEDEDLDVVYGFICTYGFNWAFVYFCRPNQEGSSRVNECTNISKKISKSSKHKLEFWPEEHKKIEFLLTSQHYFWVKL